MSALKTRSGHSHHEFHSLFLAHIMALATNSPFWLGLNTVTKATAPKCLENFPRTGIPDAFSSYSEFENYVSLLVKTIASTTLKKSGGTSARIHSSIRSRSVPAIFRCALKRQWRSPRSFRPRRRIFIVSRVESGFSSVCAPASHGNKFRAVRYGLDGNLIDFGRRRSFHCANCSKSI